MMKILKCSKFIEKHPVLPLCVLILPFHFSHTSKIYMIDRISPAAPQLSKVARLDIFKPSLFNGCRICL